MIITVIYGIKLEGMFDTEWNQFKQYIIVTRNILAVPSNTFIDVEQAKPQFIWHRCSRVWICIWWKKIINFFVIEICSRFYFKKNIPASFIGIFIKSVLPGGQAAEDGRLKAGDEILAVNGQVCHDLTHREAVQLFRNNKSGPVALHLCRRSKQRDLQ